MHGTKDNVIPYNQGNEKTFGDKYYNGVYHGSGRY
jgi:hypothetical protein